MAELGNTIGDELLKVHVSYGLLVQALLKKFNPSGPGVRPDRGSRDRCPDLKAFAHITGGGFIDNIPRVLPKNCDAVIRKGSWEMLPIFRIVAARGDVSEDELYQVFNMGIGLTAIVAPDEADAALKFIRAQRHKAWIIGAVTRGTGIARIT